MATASIVTYEIVHHSNGYLVLRCHRDGGCVVVDQFADLEAAQDFTGFLSQQFEQERQRRLMMV